MCLFWCLVLITLFPAWLDIPKCQAVLLNGWNSLSHPLQEPPLSRSPHTDTYFYKFTITTRRSKAKIPLKVHELEGAIMESKKED